MQSRLLVSLFVITPALLCACSAQQSSVEKTARHVALQLASIHFDPNTRPLTTDNTRMMVRFFSQFYSLGKKDRNDGLNREQAQLRVSSFSEGESNIFTPDGQTTTFVNRQYTAERPEKRSTLIREGAIASYWDGYNGKP